MSGFTNILERIKKSKSEQKKRIDQVTGGIIEMWSLDNPTAGRGQKAAAPIPLDGVRRLSCSELYFIGFHLKVIVAKLPLPVSHLPQGV